MDNVFWQVMRQFPPWFEAIAQRVPNEKQEQVTELRLFEGQIALWMIGRQGFRFDKHRYSQTELEEIFCTLCHGSVHRFQREIAEGFITLQGGHRVGLCGTAVFHPDRPMSFRQLTSMNIRFAKAWYGCGQELYQKMKQLDLEYGSFLLAGAPASGKTTVLRDYVRLLTGEDKKSCIVVLIDERGEFSGFDLGTSTHVLKGMSKEKAILQALRTLAPQLIVCDEIGSANEAELLCEGLNAGSHFIGTIHAQDWESLRKKPQLQAFLKQRSLSAIAFLKEKGQLREIQCLE